MSINCSREEFVAEANSISSFCDYETAVDLGMEPSEKYKKIIVDITLQMTKRVGKKLLPLRKILLMVLI